MQPHISPLKEWECRKREKKEGPKNHSGRGGLNKALRHGDKTSARSKKSEEGT